MDRRSLNALRKRRAARHLSACLGLLAALLLLLGAGAGAAWLRFRAQLPLLAPLVVLGLIQQQ